MQEVEEEIDQAVNMPSPSDPNAATEAERLSEIRQRVEFKISRLRPDRITDSHVVSANEKLSDILDLSEQYGIGITAMLRNFPSIEESFKLQYQADLDSVLQAVDDIEDRVRDKIHQLGAVPRVGLPAAAQATGGQSQGDTQQSVAAAASMARSASIAKAAIKYKNLIDLALSTTQDMEQDGLYLDTADNERIQRLVMKTSKFEKIRDTIKASHTEYLEFTAVDKPDIIQYEPNKLDEAVKGALSSVATLISSLEEQDVERQLGTLLPRKTERVKWPSFSGNPGESLFKFKEQFMKAARQNQTNREDQFTKLRENLKDFPLTLIPEHMNDVQAAFKRLSETYGDPQKLVNFELKKFEKVDMFPNSDDGSYTIGTRAQAEWLLQVETVLAELINMASEDDADRDIERSVYGPQTTSTLLAKFPLVLKQKLISAAKADTSSEKLVVFQKKFKEWSAQALELEKYSPDVKAAPKKAVQQVQIVENNQINLFKPPKPLPTCLVCVELQKNQHLSPQLPHLSAHVTGCPKFIEMNIPTRLPICNALKLCKMCLREDSAGHEKFCMVLKIKSRNKAKSKYDFTCTEQYCYRHMWLCTKHKSENQESMDAKATQLATDHGLRLVHLLAFNNIGLSTSQPSHVPNSAPQTDSGEESPPDQLTRPCADSKAFRIAERKLKKKARKSTNSPVEVVPVPEGNPMFMFQALRGRTKPVFAFYDSGCSNACLRSGIPGDQLRGQVLAKGPFIVEGVKGVLIQADDEWLVHLDRVDGKKQELRGLTLDQITAGSPKFNIEEATRAVKGDKPGDDLLQKCSLPMVVGGTVDILIGIQYNSIFPQPIHRLPNGLEIYKCVLASHDSSINATIGGPHSSFEALAGQHGGAASVLALFLAGLEKFTKWGPPSIKANPFTLEEVELAKTLNSFDGDQMSEELMQVERAEEYLEAVWNDESITAEKIKVNQAATSEVISSKVILTVCECQSLCQAMNKNPVDVPGDQSQPDLEPTTAEPALASVNFADIEKISPLCRLKLLEDSGLNVEYRCVKCRECSDCRNSDESEKTSLREESEEQLIKDSVKLDIPNRRIICSLPIRGPEREFLTTNKDRALKVLDQQCRKYHGDEEIIETALKAFKKLFDNGHAALIKDLDDDLLEQFVNKDPQYFIPWRLVFKDSVSTPCRAVLDGSSKTKHRKDGTAGRCLNDLVVKGKVTTINLVKMLLRFTVGLYAVNGDLKQFYNSCKLVVEQWNLQRFLYRENMDPNNPPLEGVIKTLIYGVKSVSRQSEYAIGLLADYIRDKFPEVAKLLEESRYVDDEGESKATREECYSLIEQANETFALVNLEIKEWLVSGEVPSDKISKDGASVDVGGMRWFPKLDTVEVKIPPLHFGKKTRGRLGSKIEIFGSFGISPAETLELLDGFVPKKLTRRMVASKRASIFDILGKLAVILISSSVLLRLTIKTTLGWDDEMPSDLRSKWLKQFLLWEQLRGIQFDRAIMPEDAVDSKLRVIAAVDAAKPAMVVGAWAGFRRPDNTYSCQLMIGRALLTAEDATIPKSELTSFTCGSNLVWLIRKTLRDWIDSYILVGDSVITLCWLSSEKKRLSQFVRNRVIQVRRTTELKNMYHVTTDQNPADVGTRPELVTLEDVQTRAKWISGVEWMRNDIPEAVSKGILKPVSELRLSTKEELDSYYDGCVFDQIPEVLTRGHVLNQRRISLIQERAAYSKYLLVPTKYGFRKTVRIYSYVFCFIQKLKAAVRKRKGRIVPEEPMFEGAIKFSIFTSTCENDQALSQPQQMPVVYLYFAEFAAAQSPPGYFALTQCGVNATAAVPEVTDKFINMALTYLYRKASGEVTKFNNQKTVQKIAVEQEQILFSKNRILDTMSFAEMGDLGLSDLPVMGIRSHVPVIDRHSPLAYSIAQHIHWNISHHRGVESCHRFSLQNCFIMQGMSLYKELADDCLWCAKKRKKLVEVSMGPISDHQLSISPPFWCCQVDLFGPLYCYVPGHERSTRNKPAAQVKTWILTCVCEVTKLVNCQVVEKSDASGILDGITRLGCEVGVPSLMLADQGSNLMKAIREAGVTLLNLKLQIYEEKGIKMEVCSVGGHNEHGLVERVIRSLQESMEECGLRSKKLSATGLQTLAKLVENDYNNLPAGFKYDRDQDNTEILKILTPNMLRMGRINTRALSGPLKLPSGASDMVEKVIKMYEAWYKVWSETYIPKLLFRPKWFKNETDLKIGDLVYFRKSESELGSTWMLGMISDVEISRDDLIRIVEIKYRNASEGQDRTTRRNVRNVCKIWSEDDWNMQDDMAELAARLREVEGGQSILDGGCHSQPQPEAQLQEDGLGEGPSHPPQGADHSCCCQSHCSVLHTSDQKLRSYQALVNLQHTPCDLQPMVPSFRVFLVESMDVQVADAEPALDNLTDYMLHFNNI